MVRALTCCLTTSQKAPPASAVMAAGVEAGWVTGTFTAAVALGAGGEAAVVLEPHEARTRTAAAVRTAAAEPFEGCFTRAVCRRSHPLGPPWGERRNI